MRITKDRLQLVVDRINYLMCVPKTAKYGDVGFYCLDWAYGQPALIRCGRGGEIVIISRRTSRELHDCMCSYADGVAAAFQSMVDQEYKEKVGE